MRTIGLIFKKEIKNALRDRRTIISVVLIPLVVFPVLGILPMAMIGRQEQKVQEQLSKIVLTGKEFPRLTTFLESTGRFLFESVPDPAQALGAGTVDCVVRVEKGFEPDSTARVKLSFDATRSSSRGAADKVRLALSGFTDVVVAERLGKIGVDPAILKRARVVVDNWEQASHSGEINVAVSKGAFTRKDVVADIGEVVTGKAKVRQY